MVVAWSCFSLCTYPLFFPKCGLYLLKGKTQGQVSLRWLLQKDFIPSVIIGAKTVQQLEQNMAVGTGWKLTDEEVTTITYELSIWMLDYAEYWTNRNRKLKISRAPTKAKSREPAYSQAKQEVKDSHTLLGRNLVGFLLHIFYPVNAHNKLKRISFLIRGFCCRDQGNNHFSIWSGLHMLYYT